MLQERGIEKVFSAVARAKASIVPGNMTVQEPGYSNSMEPEPRKGRSKPSLTAIVLALYLSQFIAALDQTIVATSIPSISDSLHGSSGFIWIGGAYLMANAAGAPIWVKLSDIWGRKPVLLTAVAWFSFSSIVCATAKTMDALIVGRAFQGTAGGGLMTLVNVTISDIFSLRHRALFNGILGAIWGIAAGVGPVLGGTFSQLLSWRWNFWINLPIAGTAFVLLLFFLDVHNPRTNTFDGIRAIDWIGSISILAVTIMLLLGLNFGGQAFPWDSPKVICLIVFGAATSILFVYSEKKLARYPLMPFSIFRNPSNIAALLVAFVHSAAFIGGEYYLPLYFQSVRQDSPLRSGLMILPFVLTEALGDVISGVMIYRTGRYLELTCAGLVLMTAGLGLFVIFNAFTPVSRIIGIEMLAGVGSGLLFGPPMIALQAMVKQHQVAAATGCLAFIREVATALGVVIGGVIFENGMDSRAKELRDVGISSELVDAFAGHDAESGIPLMAKIMDAGEKLAVREAYARALRNTWIFYTCFAAVGLICSAFLSKAVVSHEHIETKTGLREEEKVEPTQADPSIALRTVEPGTAQ